MNIDLNGVIQVMLLIITLLFVGVFFAILFKYNKIDKTLALLIVFLLIFQIIVYK